MARRRCCCPGACYTFYDQFNRADNTALGADWTEVTGDWEIVDGQLYESGTADAKCITTAQVPADSAGEMDCFVQVYNYSIGDVFRLYVAWDSITEFYMVEATYAGADSWDIELFYNGGSLATTTQLATAYGTPPDQYVVMRGCIDSDGNFKGGVISTADELAWVTAAGAPIGRKAGVGHDNSGGATFDEFFFIELRTEDIVCSQCWCHCNGNVPSKKLLATVWNATGRSSCLNLLTCDLDWVWAAGTSYWEGTLDWTGSGPCQLPLKVICDSTIDQDCEGIEWTLQVATGGACCTNIVEAVTGCPPITPDCDTSTCWPLSLVFGPFEMTDSDLVCLCCHPPGSGTTPGYYYIIVTDQNE